MGQVYDREVEVLIWKYEGISHFGHSALKLRGVSSLVGQKFAYISYWPGWRAGLINAPFKQSALLNGDSKIDGFDEMSDDARRNLNKGRFEPRSGQVIVAQTDKNDLIYLKSQEEVKLDEHVVVEWAGQWGWIQQPEYRIHLPALGATGVEYGLDVDRMYSWFQAFVKNPNPRYRLASKTRNCAGVVALALNAGGAGHYIPPPSAKVFMDPNQIWHWAEELDRELGRLNESAQNQSTQVYQPRQVTELMSCDQWKTLSTQGVSRFTHRPGQFRKIDGYLREYFAAGSWSSAANQKRILLGKMAYEVHSYLASNFNAKREDAALRLAEDIRCLMRIHRPGINWMGDPLTMKEQLMMAADDDD